MKRFKLTSLLALLILVLCPKIAQAAPNVTVGLIWNLAGQDCLGFEVVQGAYSLEKDGKIINPQVMPGTAYRVGNGPWGMALFENGNPLGFSQKVKFVPVKGNLPVFTVYSSKGSKKYRGALEITYRNANLQVTNILGEQEYLYGVVPVEMSNGWAAQGLEALKAQAVAARTYLQTHYDSKMSKGYNITDSPDVDQAYAGFGVEGAASKAVEATSGEILIDKTNRKPINTSYHSHSGGHTEDSENVWGGVDPHLRGKPDPFSLNQGFLADRWEFIASGPAIGKALGLGPVVDMKLEKYPSGRVKTVVAKDINGNTVSKSGRQFAGLFYPKNKGISRSDFLGSLFSVETLKPGIPDREKPSLWDIFTGLGSRESGPRLDRIDTSSSAPRLNPSPYPVFRFVGSGWGHGVGMSQWGAYGMAKQGYNYRQILYYYYSQVEIGKSG